MVDEKIELLLLSYTLSDLLERCDIEESYVVEMLIIRGLIDLEEFDL